MNGVNLGLFQFEYDLTWMAFFMDAHDRFYARYGGREDGDPEAYLTKNSLVRVMQEVLKRHRAGDVQTGRYEPDGRSRRTPEEIPPMSAMIGRRKEKCIHCHDVKVAELRDRQQRNTFTRDLIFTYPPPTAVGIQVDRDEQNRVASVQPNSPAASAGLKTGDRLVSADRENILTVGDFARVLELMPPGASLPIVAERDGKPLTARLKLSGDWKRTPDPSWRASVHVAGPNAGFWAVELNDEQKRAEGLSADKLALRVTFLFPKPDIAARAGLRLKDLVIAVDGKRDRMTIRQLHAYCQLNHRFGDSIPIVMRRDGKEVALTLQLANAPPALDD
jgi:predicted metalloprotease with PDZ domain